MHYYSQNFFPCMEPWPHTLNCYSCGLVPLNRRCLLYHIYSMQALLIGKKFSLRAQSSYSPGKEFIMRYSVIMDATPHYLLTTFITHKFICPLYTATTPLRTPLLNSIVILYLYVISLFVGQKKSHSVMGTGYYKTTSM